MTRRDTIVEALGKAVETFTLHSEKAYEDVMANGISPIAEAVNLDRVAIYSKLKPEKKQLGQTYRWDKAAGGTLPIDEMLKVLPPIPVVMQWWAEAEKGNLVIRKLDTMSEEEVKFSNMFGIKSIMLVPIFTLNEFWGAVTFQDHTNVRDFDDCKDLLHAAARLCASAAIREEMAQDINRALERIKLREKMEETLNKAAIIFISQNEDSFDARMTIGVKLIADVTDLDRFSIWRNTAMPDCLHTSQIYRWDRESEGTTKPTPTLKDVTYAQLAPRWEGVLSKNEIINGPIRDLPEFKMLNSFGVVSALVIPIQIRNIFWGFALFEDRKNERYFDQDCIEIMRSTAFLCANTVIRAEMADEIIEVNKHLKDALSSLTIASKAKDEFLSRMSHEIRTPMNAILGITEIQLQDNTLPPRVIEALSSIYNSGDSLLRIINDILDLSKIEAGKLEIVAEKYEIASLINDVVQLNIMKIESKPIEFKLDIDENIPCELIGDKLRIKQILNNLLSNAFKYTDRGEVSMKVFAEWNMENTDVTLVFCISDTGQGMTSEQISRIFDKYSRFNLGINHAVEGTGLGMNITQNLIRMMDGSISVESEPNKGTVFTVRLLQGYAGSDLLGKELVENLRSFRISSASHTKRANIVREYMPHGKVLIVDDVESNIYVAKGFMAPYGLSIDTAASGFEAIEKIKEGNEYDIIFMDHMMPKMDGIETVKIIREMGYERPIVALTANAVVGKAAMFLQNGFDGFISKPIDICQLNEELNKFIHCKQPTEQQANEELLPIFKRDAEKFLSVFKSTLSNISSISDNDLELFTINAHGAKSALANIGEEAYSQIALILENAGKERNKNTIAAKTPELIDAIYNVVAKFEAKAENKTADKDSDPDYLQEQLKIISDACENYNARTANAAVENLRKMEWTSETKALIESIAEDILLSNFEEVVLRLRN